MFSKSLFFNIRFYILAFSVLLSIGLFIWTRSIYQQSTTQLLILIQYYALVAVAYLYLAIITTPLTRTFQVLPLRGRLVKARRAIGVSAFYFGLLHGSLAFFIELGGFAGLSFLDNKYLVAIILSSVALLILTLMAATSFDSIIKKLSFPVWKKLHRLVYLAGLFITIHALLLGSHFSDLSRTIPQIFMIALAILLILEARRFDNYLQTKFQLLPHFGVASLVVICATLTYLTLTLLPTDNSSTLAFGIHSQHIQIAKDLQNQANGSSSSNSNQPSFLQGDKTKRYTVSYQNLTDVSAGQNLDLNFKVYDAASGFPVQLFSTAYEKPMHCIIVDEDLVYFIHIHPVQTKDGFTVSTSFPHPGRFHIYLDFQPLGAIEQQVAFTQEVGSVEGQTPNIPTDTTQTKTFGDYQVSLDYPKPLVSSQITIGSQKFTFTILDAKTKQPITNLKPYLAAFGHLVMINTKTYDYIHVHPSNLVPPTPNSSSGPTVDFLPIGLYGPIKPGTYRLFGQFNPDNKLFTSDFTVNIQ